jgi:hypothetical protein
MVFANVRFAARNRTSAGGYENLHQPWDCFRSRSMQSSSSVAKSGDSSLGTERLLRPLARGFLPDLAVRNWSGG